MNAELSTLTPPARLAIAYALPDLRAPLALLLAFDDRIADVIARSSEPIFAQMKIAWWYDAIAKPTALRPAGEPLLAQLAQLENTGHADRLTAAMQAVLDAWSILAAAEDWAPQTLENFAEARSNAVFRSYADWAGAAEAVDTLGRTWSINDLSLRFGKTFGDSDLSASYRTPRAFRPLSILALSTRPDVSGPRLIWHALTGR